MKKIISLLAVIMLTATMLSSVVFAESVPTVNVSNNNGAVTFSVSSSFTGTGSIPESGKTASFSFAKSGVSEEGGYSVNLDSDYSIEGIGADGTFSIAGDGSKDITVKFLHAGVYVFTLKETTAYQDAFVYDDSVYTLRFYVKNESSGLNASMTAETESSSEKKNAVTFVNKYAPATYDPPVSKKVVDADGNVVASNDTFTFKITADKNGWPLPEGAENGVDYATIKGAGTTEFGTITFTKAGTYSYTITEVKPESTKDFKNDYKWDMREVTYTYTVSRAGTGALDGTLKVERTDVDKNTAEFTNVIKKAETEPETVETETPETNEHNSVKTGDDNPIMLYLVLMAAMAAVICVVVVERKKQ